jgi:hypothetical protein
MTMDAEREILRTGSSVQRVVRENRVRGRKTAKAVNAKHVEGQATVEFALVVSLLLLVLFGIIDFSRLFFAYATMSNGVREGARYGIVHPEDTEGIIQQSEAMMVLIGGQAEVTVEFPDTGNGGNPHCAHYCRVVVRATSDFDVWTPIIPSITMVAQATMHIE